MIKSRCRIQVKSTQCTMGLSIALRISKIIKGKGPNFAQFWSKPCEAAWDRWKTAQRFRGKHIRRFFDKNVVVIGKKHDGHDWQSWNFAQRPIRTCSPKDFRATFLSVTPFRVHISSKYFHSLKPQNHMKFNSSQIWGLEGRRRVFEAQRDGVWRGSAVVSRHSPMGFGGAAHW